MDSVDWEEVRQTTNDKIADAIKGEGQHRMLAKRIKVYSENNILTKTTSCLQCHSFGGFNERS